MVGRYAGKMNRSMGDALVLILINIQRLRPITKMNPLGENQAARLSAIACTPCGIGLGLYIVAKQHQMYPPRTDIKPIASMT